MERQNGITLVVLVITIIILLILAGIAISTLTQTGLFGNAKQAENTMKNAQNQENLTLGRYENKINEVTSEISSSRDTVTISKEEYDKLKSDVEKLNKKNTIKSSKISILSNMINGNKFYLNQVENVVSIEINGDTGSQNIKANEIVCLATGLPKAINNLQELSVTLDNISLYARSWVDQNGNLYIWQSGSNYVGNVFIGGTYITNE